MYVAPLIDLKPPHIQFTISTPITGIAVIMLVITVAVYIAIQNNSHFLYSCTLKSYLIKAITPYL